MLNQTKIVAKRLVFGDLPPRVIIYDILSYYVLSINGKFDIENGFILFGRFKRDQGRNIWQIFNSISAFNPILKRTSTCSRTPMCMDIRKISFLRLLFSNPALREKSKVFMTQLSSQSNRMYSLRRLILKEFTAHGYSNIATLKKFRFPKLKLLIFGVRGCLSRDIEDSETDEKKLENKGEEFLCYPTLTFFSLRATEVRKSVSFFSERDNFSSLKVFRLENIHNSFPVTLFLPKLEQIGLRNVRNIKIIPGEELKVIRVRENEGRENICDLFRNSKKVKILTLISNSETQRIPFKYVFDLSPNRLKNLETLEFTHSTVGNPKFSQGDVGSIMKLKDQLRKLRLSQNYFEFDIFDGVEFKNLRVLSMIFTRPVESVSGYNWNISLNLKKLRVYGSRFCDKLFSRNEWPELKILYLFIKRSDNEVTGRSWNRIPKLKEFYVLHSNHFADTFFEEHDEFNMLEFVEIVKDSGSLKGEKWNEVIFKNLKVLKIVDCPNITDEFFQKNQFLKLEKLTISGNNFTGKSWKKMNSLRCLDFKGCPDFVSDFDFCDKDNLEIL